MIWTVILKERRSLMILQVKREDIAKSHPHKTLNI